MGRTRTGSSVRLRKFTTERLECRNSFPALAEVQEEEEAEGRDRKVDATSLSGGKVLVVNLYFMPIFPISTHTPPTSLTSLGDRGESGILGGRHM